MGSPDQESSGAFIKVVEMELELDLDHLGYSPDRYVRAMDQRWDEKAGMA